MGVTDPAVLHNELENLADVVRHEINASRGPVADLFSLDARELCAVITARLVRAGVERRVAEFATTAWALMPHASVLECVEKARRL